MINDGVVASIVMVRQCHHLPSSTFDVRGWYVVRVEVKGSYLRCIHYVRLVRDEVAPTVLGFIHKAK